jgi:hypothetical protein
LVFRLYALEDFGEMKSMCEERHNLKNVLQEFLPKTDVSSMTKTLGDSKKALNITIIKAEIDQEAVYEKIRQTYQNLTEKDLYP